METIKKSIENSLCFGMYADSTQIGFARCVTDFATIYWLCDVIVDDRYRGQGLGNALIRFITERDTLKPLTGILATRDAHGLYEKYGFKPEETMRRRPQTNQIERGGEECERSHA
jgi:GNAT superfamily N-acetyltransferase